MLCATINSQGAVVVTTPQPADVTSCPVVIPSSADFVNQPLNLSAEDGLAVASAIVLVWGVGFAARALIRSLSIGENHHETD